MIEPVKVVAADLKGGNASGRVLDPDPAQVTALAQEERPDEDVRGLVMLGDKSSPPFLCRKPLVSKTCQVEYMLIKLTHILYIRKHK